MDMPTLRVGQRVEVPGKDWGTVRYIGPMHFKPSNKTYVGIQLDSTKGKNDGVVKGKRYFDAIPLTGVFIPQSRLGVFCDSQVQAEPLSYRQILEVETGQDENLLNKKDHDVQVVLEQYGKKALPEKELSNWQQSFYGDVDKKDDSYFGSGEQYDDGLETSNKPKKKSKSKKKKSPMKEKKTEEKAEPRKKKKKSTPAREENAKKNSRTMTSNRKARVRVPNEETKKPKAKRRVVDLSGLNTTLTQNPSSNKKKKKRKQTKVDVKMDQISQHVLKKGEKPRVQEIQDKMIENLLKHEQSRLEQSSNDQNIKGENIETINSNSKRKPDLLETNKSESSLSNKKDPGICVGDRVQVTRKCWGVVKWIGCLPDKAAKIIYYGVALDQTLGKNNGTYKGKRLFRCKNNCGIFVRFNRLVSTCDIPFESFRSL